MATLDLNAIADALAAVFQGVDTSEDFSGQDVLITAQSEGAGVAYVPAVVLELDDLTYDLSMGQGAHGCVFIAHLAVSEADAVSGQRLIRSMLSTGGLVDRLKDSLVDNQSLGGLVSYAHCPGTRSIGSINIGGVSYLGADLEIVVMS